MPEAMINMSEEDVEDVDEKSAEDVPEEELEAPEESIDEDDHVESEAPSWPVPLADDQMDAYELWLSRLLVGILGTLLLGSLLVPSIFWDGFLAPMVWEPINQDATSGDAGYNPVNTLLFTVVLLLFVVALSALFRKWGLPADSTVIIAFIPWVIFASVVRVLEDSELFPESYQAVFISPIIHFHLALWVVYIAMFGSWADGRRGERLEPIAIKGRHRMGVVVTILLMWLLLFASPFGDNPDLGPLWTIPSLMAALLVGCWLVGDSTEDWHGIPRSLYGVGWAAVILGLGFWMQFNHYPWHESRDTALWPALVILGVPTLICWQMYRMGSAARTRMLVAGYEPGVLPEGIGVKQWEESTPEGKEEYEVEVRWALLADPLVLAFTFGQLCDGLATWMGIDFFGYSEKHVVSAQIIVWGQQLTGGMGAWLFFLVKAVLTGLLILVFSSVRVEHRHRHLRVLVVLALLVVGLAPGLRDLGRLLLGV